MGKPKPGDQKKYYVLNIKDAQKNGLIGRLGMTLLSGMNLHWNHDWKSWTILIENQKDDVEVFGVEGHTPDYCKEAILEKAGVELKMLKELPKEDVLGIIYVHDNPKQKGIGNFCFSTTVTNKGHQDIKEWIDGATGWELGL